MARETINGISVPIPGTGEPADFVGDLRRIASDLSASTDARNVATLADPETAPGATVETAVKRQRTTRAVSLSSDPLSTREYPRVRKISTTPIFDWDADVVDQTLYGLYWPWLIDLSQGGGVGVGLLRSTDHATNHAISGISLATADSLADVLDGTTFVDQGLIWRDNGGGSQCETPSVWRDTTYRGSIGVGVAFSSGADTVTKSDHGLVEGNPVILSSLSGVVGVTEGVVYYATAVTTNTFKLTATIGGPAIDITAGGTGNVRHYGRWLMGYQLQGVGGTVSDQVSLLAQSTSPMLADGSWSRLGVILDHDSGATLKVDGILHAGYMKPCSFGGQRFAYSNFVGTSSGTRYGRYMKWTATDAAGTAWQAGQTVWGWPNMIDHLDGYDRALFWNIKWFLGEVIHWRGQPWWVGLAGPASSAGTIVSNRVITFPLKADLITPAARPVEITPPELLAWEDPAAPIDYLGNSLSADGRLVIAYRSGGRYGSFGLMEVI